MVHGLLLDSHKAEELIVSRALSLNPNPPIRNPNRQPPNPKEFIVQEDQLLVVPVEPTVEAFGGSNPNPNPYPNPNPSCNSSPMLRLLEVRQPRILSQPEPS